MTQILLSILGISCFSVLFAEVSGMIDIIKDLLHIQGRFKPFDCPLCLSWWLALFWFALTLHSPAAVLYAAICSLLSVWVSKAINR